MTDFKTTFANGKPIAEGQLKQDLLDLWREHKGTSTLPTNTRFLYYELVALGKVSKEKKPGQKKEPYQYVCEALTFLRQNKYIPWEDIRDESRDITQPVAYDSIAEGVRVSVEYSRLKLWKGELPPMIITESRSLRSVLENLCDQYQTPLVSTNGSCGGFLHTDIGPALTNGQRILYFGDWDFQGGMIQANTKTVLTEIVGSLLWENLALTEDQVRDFDLPVIQRYDNRTKKYKPAVETEALGQIKIVALLQKRLSELMPDSRMRAVFRRENKEREALKLKIYGSAA